MLTHLPYADWCPYCVAGKRPNSPHRRVRQIELEVPMLCADYGFFHDNGKPLVPMLVISIKPFNVYYATVVHRKGSTPEISNWVATLIQESGLVRFVYRSDRELAIRDMLKDAVRESGREGRPVDPEVSDEDEKPSMDPDAPVLPTTAPMTKTQLAAPEHSHTGESQSNGYAERAVQLVEDQARTLKAALEDRMQTRIPCDHALMRWLI